MSKNGAELPSIWADARVSRLQAQLPGWSIRKKVITLLRALLLHGQLSSGRPPRLGQGFERRRLQCCSRRLTNPISGSLPGSLIQRETRSSYGSRLKANEQARWSRLRTAAQSIAQAWRNQPSTISPRGSTPRMIWSADTFAPNGTTSRGRLSSCPVRTREMLTSFLPWVMRHAWQQVLTWNFLQERTEESIYN